MTNGKTVEVRRDWHVTKKGCASMTLRLDKISVRVTQRTPNGPYCRIMYLKGVRNEGASSSDQSWASLCTTDKGVAKARAEAFLRALLASLSGADEASSPTHSPTDEAAAPIRDVQPAAIGSSLTLEKLVTCFMEAPRFRKLDIKTQYDARRRGAVLLASLGPNMAVDQLDEDVLDLHVVRRRAGGIEYVIHPVSRTGATASAARQDEPARA